MGAVDRRTGLFLGVAFIVAGAAIIMAGCLGPQADSKPSATTSTTMQATTSTAPVSTTAAPATTTSTTSTTLPTTTTLPARLSLNWTDIGKCKETLLGKMNFLYIEIPDTLVGVWGETPAQAVSVSCDGRDDVQADRLVYRGGNTVGKEDPLAGEYRVMLKCGHNARITDLADCMDVEAYLNSSAVRMA